MTFIIYFEYNVINSKQKYKNPAYFSSAFRSATTTSLGNEFSRALEETALVVVAEVLLETVSASIESSSMVIVISSRLSLLEPLSLAVAGKEEGVEAAVFLSGVGSLPTL